EFAVRNDAEHARAIDLALLPELDQIVEQSAPHLRPEVAPDVKIGLEAARMGLRLKPQRVVSVAGHPIIDVGAKMQDLSVTRPFDLHLDREEWGVLHQNAAFLHRG